MPHYGYYDPESKGWGAQSARRYEKSGQLNIPAALGLQFEIGKENIAARVHQLSLQLREGLRAIPRVRPWISDDPQFHARITSFRVGDFPQNKLFRTLLEQENIIIRSMKQADVDALRVSTQNWNPRSLASSLIALWKYNFENGRVRC